MARIVKKPEERKKEIVKAARILFQTKEYDQTTMQDVINSVGIAKGTIYHYFKSKEALFEAVIEDIVEESVKEMKALLKKSKGSALEKIQLLAKAGDVSHKNKSLLDELHKPANDAMHSRLLAAALTKQAPLYAKIIEQGCEEGIFKTEAPLECAEFILSAIQFLTDRGFYSWTTEELKRRIKAFPKLVEQLLQAPPGCFQFLAEELSSS